MSNQEYKEEMAAMLRQVAVSSQEINRTIISEEKNIDIIKDNLNMSTINLQALSEYAGKEAELSKEVYSDIDNKLNAVQEAAAQSMIQARKAEKQKPLFESISKMIETVIETLNEIQEEILGPMHILAVNSAIKAAGSIGGDQGLSNVLMRVSEFIDELEDKSTKKIQLFTSTIKPYIEIAKNLAVVNDELFESAKNSSEKMSKTYDFVQEIKIGSEGQAETVKDLKERIDDVLKSVTIIDGHVMEFAGSVKQTTQAIGEIEEAITNINNEYHKKEDISDSL